MPAGKRRHVVNVMRPQPPQGEAGENNPPETYYRNVPCSIEQTAGREAERMFQMYAVSTYKIGFYGDPERRIKTTDWLAFGDRTFNILQVNDEQQNGVKIELICGEGQGL